MMTKEQKLNITGMTCGHCSMTVEKKLQALDGVEKVVVSLDENAATVIYNGELLKPGDLVAALEDTSYQVSLA